MAGDVQKSRGAVISLIECGLDCVCDSGGQIVPDSKLRGDKSAAEK
jgi:hypothetical protein